MSKAHKLPRLSKSLLESPQLITESKFREIAEVLDNRENMKSYQEQMFFDMDDHEDDNYETEESSLLKKGIGLLEVSGPTTYKPTGWEALCGGTSYVGLMNKMEELVEKGVSTVLMKIDSHGGMAYRMISTAVKLRKLADDNDIRLVGYIDGCAASAGYGLAAACHELVANPDAEAGSIGVVVALINDSKHLEKEGYERTFITAGSEKVPYNKDGSFRDSFLQDIQDNVDALYVKFTSHVANMRDIDVDVVTGTQARMFKADKALEIGLIDAVMEEDEFQEYLGISPTGDKSPLGVNTTGAYASTTLNKTTEELSMSKEQGAASTVDTNAELAELQAKLAQFEKAAAEQEQLAAKLAEYEQKEITAKKEALTEQLSAHSFLSGVQEDLVAVLMDDSVSAAHKELFNSIVSASADEINTISEKLSNAEQEFADKEASLNSEMDKIKSEFATKPQESDDSSVTVAEESTMTTADLQAKVAEHKAAKKKS